MTRAIFEAETRDDLKHFVALARKQGITVKYLRISVNTPAIKKMQQRRYNTETLAAMQEARDIMSEKRNLAANIKQGFADKKSIDKGLLTTFPIENLFDE